MRLPVGQKQAPTRVQGDARRRVGRVGRLEEARASAVPLENPGDRSGLKQALVVWGVAVHHTRAHTVQRLFGSREVAVLGAARICKHTLAGLGVVEHAAPRLLVAGQVVEALAGVFAYILNSIDHTRGVIETRDIRKERRVELTAREPAALVAAVP